MRSKIKVLHFLTHGYIGGQERAIYQLLKGFQNDTEYKFGISITNSKGFFVDRIKELNVPIYNLNLKSGFDFRFRTSLLNELSRYDIYHFHDPAPIEIIYGMLANPSGKRVFTRRGGDVDYSQYGFKAKLKHTLKGYFIRRYFHAYSGNTQHAAESARKLYNLSDKEIDCLYNPIDFSMLQPTISRAEALTGLKLSTCDFLIGTACRLDPVKRVDILIDAIACCGIDNLKLLIFGDGSERQKIAELVRLKNLGTKVVFLGEVEDIHNYYQILHCFVLASGKEESFGNSVVEAMYNEVPTIVFSDSPGLKEHVCDKKTGFVVDSVSQLTDSIHFIYNYRSESKRIASIGSLYVKNKYSLERMMSEYKKFYKKIMDSVE